MVVLSEGTIPNTMCVHSAVMSTGITQQCHFPLSVIFSLSPVFWTSSALLLVVIISVHVQGAFVHLGLPAGHAKVFWRVRLGL